MAKEDPRPLIALESGLGTMEISEASEETSSSSERREIDERLDALLPLDPTTEEESEEPRTLYELLDEVPNGRKLMNHLFCSATELQLDERQLSKGHLHKTASVIADRWYEEEKRASTQALPAALQLDAPVIFSWSKKAAGGKTSSQKTTPNSSVRDTTNQTLFKSISARLNQIAKQGEIGQQDTCYEDGSIRSEMSPSKQRWASSEFHVDPLQQFVATALPRASKRENNDKKKVKRRSILNFWGSGGNHKKKEDRKTNKEVEPDQDRKSSELPQPIEQNTIAEDPEPIKQDLPEQGSQIQSPSSAAMSLNSFVPLQPKKK